MKLLLSIIVAIAATIATSFYRPEYIIPTLHALRTTPLVGLIANRTIPLLVPPMSTSPDFAGLPAVPPQDPSLNAPPNTTVPRKIRFHFEAIETAEGAGARVRRSIGTAKIKTLSPFLVRLDFVHVSPC